jgi:tRNA A37 threonylcarbamoyladenosine dehydratase
MAVTATFGLVATAYVLKRLANKSADDALPMP